MKISVIHTLAIASILASTIVIAEDSVTAKKRIEVATAPADVWEKIGDFCAIADWHPVVEKCEIMEADGETFRLLTLGDGATIKEKHLGAGDVETSYRYEIVEGPLPVMNYISTFAVTADDIGAGIKWNSDFKANGVSADEAKELIEGIYTAGLDSIESMF